MGSVHFVTRVTPIKGTELCVRWGRMTNLFAANWGQLETAAITRVSQTIPTFYWGRKLGFGLAIR